MDINELTAGRRNERFALHEKYLSPFPIRSARKVGAAQDYVRAEGCWIQDAQGNRYLDCDGGSGVFNIGRNHPRARQMLTDLLAANPANMVMRDTPILAGLLAEKLAAITPRGLTKVIFTTTGSETVEAGLKFARRLTGRPRLLYVEGDYHGVTYGALSVTDVDFANEGFGPMLPGCERVPRNDLNQLAAQLARGDVAALVVEPIQGLDVRALNREYLQGAQALCRQYGTVFIVDEVFVGFGRTGTMFASERMGIEPDLLVLSKSLSGGFVPVGALMIREELYNRVFTDAHVFVHGSTFEFNDFGMAAGLATLTILADEDLVGRAARTGALLSDGLKQLQSRYDMIADVRVYAMLVGIEFRSPRALNLRVSGRLLEKRGMLGLMVLMQLLAKHRVLAAVVERNNILRLTPPLVMSESDVAYFLDALESVLKDIYRFPDGIGKFVLTQILKMLREKQ